jgi:hypothetical protein
VLRMMNGVQQVLNSLHMCPLLVTENSQRFRNIAFGKPKDRGRNWQGHPAGCWSLIQLKCCDTRGPTAARPMQAAPPTSEFELNIENTAQYEELDIGAKRSHLQVQK